MRRNLGDAYLKVGKEQDAEKEFDHAVKLIKERLRVEQGIAEPFARLALCLAKLRRKIEALENIDQATSLEPHNTLVMYLRAVVLALVGERGRAIENLSMALQHGYSLSEAQRDPDLESIRNDPLYKALFVER